MIGILCKKNSFIFIGSRFQAFCINGAPHLFTGRATTVMQEYWPSTILNTTQNISNPYDIWTDWRRNVTQSASAVAHPIFFDYSGSDVGLVCPFSFSLFLIF